MPTARELLDKFDDSKTLPHVAMRIIHLVNDENSTPQDFEDIIKLDPVLLTRLLRIVNSAYFGLMQKVESTSKAVVFVGMKNLRNLVTVEVLKNIFKEKDNVQIFSRKKVWAHSATVAILAQMIAQRLLGQEGGDLFLAGIMHDIGLIVEDQVEGEKLRRACESHNPAKQSFPRKEQRVIGADHCEIGALLAKELNLAPELQQAIRDHHNAKKQSSPASMAGIIQIADYLACNLKYAPFGDKAEMGHLPKSLATHIHSQIHEYKVIIRNLPAQIAKARELYEIEG